MVPVGGGVVVDGGVVPPAGGFKVLVGDVVALLGGGVVVPVGGGIVPVFEVPPVGLLGFTIVVGSSISLTLLGRDADVDVGVTIVSVPAVVEIAIGSNIVEIAWTDEGVLVALDDVDVVPSESGTPLSPNNSKVFEGSDIGDSTDVDSKKDVSLVDAMTGSSISTGVNVDVVLVGDVVSVVVVVGDEIELVVETVVVVVPTVEEMLTGLKGVKILTG